MVECQDLGRFCMGRMDRQHAFVVTDGIGFVVITRAPIDIEAEAGRRHAKRELALGGWVRGEFRFDDAQPLPGAIELMRIDLAELSPDVNPVGCDLRDRLELLRAGRDVVEAFPADPGDPFAKRRLFLDRKPVESADEPIA